MLLVLPPSRGQSAGPSDAPTLDLSHLALPELTEARSRLLALLAGGEHDPAHSPAARAADVLTGVLFAAADLPGLLGSRGAARTRASEQVLIASPLLGMVTPVDPVPASRLTMAGTDRTGGLGPFWRPHLERVLNARVAQDLVVDVRSSEFLPLWRPPATAEWVQVSVVQQVGTQRRVVSHFAKHWRGLLVHHLLRRRGSEPSDLRSLVRAASGLVKQGAILAVEHHPAPAAGKPATLTLVCP